MRLRDEIRTWETSTVLLWVVCATVGIVSVLLDLGVHLWAWWTSSRPSPPWNPFSLVPMLLRGSLPATGGMWVCVGLVAAFLLLVASAPWLALRGARSRRRRGDEAAALVGDRRDTEPLSRDQVEATARRLKVGTDSFGLPVGRAVRDNRPLYSDFEAVAIAIAGPRTGKTTCWVVPRILAAPGFVVATSNKPDIVELTRQVRCGRGQVWVFDPEQIVGEPQSFWWNLLGYVTDSKHATVMAQALMDASRPAAGGQSNPFFDTGARDLVARFLLAAARSGRSLAAVKQWVNDPGDDEAVALLRQAGEHEKADELQATLNMVEVTRSGIFAGAQQIMEFTADERIMSWVTPNGWISELRPEDLVSGTDTLYLLSQEGPVSAAPVVTALTMALTEAAMEHAKRQPAGRLSIPGLVMLDEAANVCRWGQLPSLYSHFGSRGILVDTILQSWSQGVTAWGREGMQTLWSASNVKVYGGSVAEPEFLSMISDLIGSHWVDQVQTTSSRGGSSSTRSLEAQERKIAPIDQLGSLPKGRAWVLASGSTALLSRLVPFWEETMRTTSKAKCTMSDDVLAEASQEIAKAWRAGMQIAEFMAIRRQRELARAQRNSTEDERRLRQVIEGERRLAAPVYRAALDKGWWETASAEQAAHTHCVAVRFSRLDPQAEQAVIECERQARLKWNIDLAQTRRPLRSQDVDSKALAATAPAIAGEEQENWGQHLDQSAHDRAHDAPSRKQPAAPASQGDAREAEKPSSRVARRRARAARACTDKEAAEAQDALHASADASTPATRAEQADVSRARAAETAWDSQAACEEWAQQQIEAGCPPDAVRAAVTGRLALHEPASQATRAPAAGAGSAGGGAAASRATQAPTRANGRGQARAARQSALRTRQQRP